MKQLQWSLDAFSAAPAIASVEPSRHASALRTRYPIRFLRYWFCRRLLEEESRRLGRSLRVLEVGIDRGQMLRFVGRSLKVDGFVSRGVIARWDGLDVQADREDLRQCGYTDFFEADVERPCDFRGRRYDAVVLSHVLEHLKNPESAMLRLVDVVEEDGLLIGGSPTMPGWLGAFHERRLRRKYADRMQDVRIHKHLSVVSPGRIRRFAQVHALSTELLAGAFFLRASGSRLENSSAWIRANLLWGALFPSLGGELYFSLRKPPMPGSQERVP